MQSFGKELALRIILAAAKEHVGYQAEVRRILFKEERETRRQIGKVLLMGDENAEMKRLEVISVQGDTTIEDLELDSLGDESLIAETIKQFDAANIPYNVRALGCVLRDGIVDPITTMDELAVHLVMNRQRITTIDQKSKM